MPRRTPLALTVAGVALAALALAGCATGVATDPGDAPSDAAPVTGAGELEVEAGWLAGGSLIALVTQGSSTCVPIASDVTVQADGSLAVTLEDPAATDGSELACTADLAPRATLVALPDGVTPGQELDIVVTYGDARGDTDLDAFDGKAVEDYSPSAAWIDDHLFTLVTWGSSSCAPVVESFEATGDAATLTFVTPPADQMCTMDMAPRVLALTTEYFADDIATVTLTGGSDFATPVTIPIEG